MNITVLYSSRAVYKPIFKTWPKFKQAYPFAELVRSYGWSVRPTMVLLSRLDDQTNLDELKRRIMLDFGIDEKEVLKLEVAGEKNQALTTMNTYKSFLEGYNDDRSDSLIVKSPDDSTWYVLVNAPDVLADLI